MSQPISGISQSKSIGALDTYTHTAGLTGVYKVAVAVSVQPGSALNIAIKQNSTTVASASILNPTQPSLSVQAPIGCTAGDVISVVLTSSALADQPPGAIKGVLNIYTGSV